MKIGVQTFTVRRAQKKSIREAYLPLLEMGIGNFEIARMEFNERNALAVKELIDEFGIEVSAIQVKPKYIFGDVSGVSEFCRITGCRRAVISMLPFGCILGSDARFYEFLGRLDGQAKIYAERGIELGYHHHNWEYVKLASGRTRMDELIDRTEKIGFVHDTYWTARCGIDPAVQIERFGDRLLGIHLRDLTHEKSFLDVRAHDAAIGDGVIDFGRVFDAAERVGCGYYVIEQKTDDPYGEIGKSYKKCKEIISGKE